MEEILLHHLTLQLACFISLQFSSHTLILRLSKQLTHHVFLCPNAFARKFLLLPFLPGASHWISSTVTSPTKIFLIMASPPPIGHLFLLYLHPRPHQIVCFLRTGIVILLIIESSHLA